jgi:hypothetical protein
MWELLTVLFPVPGIQKRKKIVSESWSFAEQLDTKK